MEFNKKQRFSIRKFKVGVCSVFLGSLLVAAPLLEHVIQPTIAYAQEFDQAIKQALQSDNYDADPVYADRAKISYK